MLKIKSIVTNVKNAFDGLVRKLDATEEKISELDDMSIEISETEKYIQQRLKKYTQEYTRTVYKNI